MEFANIYELLWDLKNHNSKNIYSNDMPIALMIRWQCEDTGKVWQIRLVDCKNSLSLGDKESSKLIYDIISNFNLKSNILKSTENVPILKDYKRYLKLKAFW